MLNLVVLSHKDVQRIDKGRLILAKGATASAISEAREMSHVAARTVDEDKVYAIRGLHCGCERIFTAYSSSGLCRQSGVCRLLQQRRRQSAPTLVEWRHQCQGLMPRTKKAVKSAKKVAKRGKHMNP